jgi:hypothetical protein
MRQATIGQQTRRDVVDLAVLDDPPFSDGVRVSIRDANDILAVRGTLGRRS